MPVITLLNQKGGVGKTTLALNLAAVFARAGDPVLYIDADPQSSALDWSAIRQTPPLFTLVSCPRKTIHEQMPTLGAGYRWVFIDGPGMAGDVAKSAILASDLCVVPLQPSGADNWSTEKILGLIGEARFYRPTLKACLVINRRIAGTAIGRDFRQRLEADHPEYPTMQTEIGQYIAFAEALSLGTTVVEIDEKGSASRQMLALAHELKEILIDAKTDATAQAAQR